MPALNKAAKPAPNFDGLARVYRWMEWLSFGPLLWRCRCAYLHEMRGCKSAFVIGDGDGRFTARLLAENGSIEVDAIDASRAMLQALTRCAGRAGSRLRTGCADAREWRPEPGALYDLVVTHFFLDCLETDEIEALAGNVRRAMAGHAVWIVSEFAIPGAGFGRWVARPLVGALYRAFGLLTGLDQRRLPAHQAALRRAGLVLTRRRTFAGGLLASEIWRRTPTA